VNITVKAIPDDLGAALKRAAEHSHRSLNGEIIHRLSVSLAENARIPEPAIAESPDAVADAWEALTGRWKSDLSVETEIAALYEGRSPGRDVDISW
jgi:plasmid stability protein